MEIRILRNCRLKNCEQIYDKEEIIETDKEISFSIIRKYNGKGNYCKKIIYMQIGNFLENDFKDYEIEEHDFIYIRKTKK